MKKNIVIYGNCHTGPIMHYLNYSDTIKKNYNLIVVSIVKYLNNKNITSFSEEDINIFSMADIFLCQYIQNDRGILNHNYIIKNYIKNDTVIITYPHHRFDGYMNHDKIYDSIRMNVYYSPLLPISLIKYFYNNPNIKSFKDGFNSIFDNINLNITDDKLLQKQNDALLKYKNINDIQSTINMTNFVTDNYKKQRLFCSSNYPSGCFFYEFIKRVLSYLKINDIKEYNKDDDYTQKNWGHTYYPILPIIKKKMQFQFNDDNFYNIIYDKNNTTNNTNNCSIDIYQYYFNFINMFYDLEYKIKNGNKIIYNYDNVDIHKTITLSDNLLFINDKNYQIKIHENNNVEITTITDDKKINYSFGILIRPTDNFLFSNADVFKGKIKFEVYDSVGNLVENYNFYNGQKWYLNCKSDDLFFDIYIKNNPRINFNMYNNVIIKCIYIDIYDI
jgi:hypothetical protein